jgi:hypothetical protein
MSLYISRLVIKRSVEQLVSEDDLGANASGHVGRCWLC